MSVHDDAQKNEKALGMVRQKMKAKPESKKTAEQMEGGRDQRPPLSLEERWKKFEAALPSEDFQPTPGVSVADDIEARFRAAYLPRDFISPEVIQASKAYFKRHLYGDKNAVIEFVREKGADALGIDWVRDEFFLLSLLHNLPANQAIPNDWKERLTELCNGLLHRQREFGQSFTQLRNCEVCLVVWLWQSEFRKWLRKQETTLTSPGAGRPDFMTKHVPILTESGKHLKEKLTSKPLRESAIEMFYDTWADFVKLNPYGLSGLIVLKDTENPTQLARSTIRTLLKQGGRLRKTYLNSQTPPKKKFGPEDFTRFAWYWIEHTILNHAQNIPQQSAPRRMRRKISR